MENKYEKLEKLRAEIKRDKEKIAKLQKGVRAKEAKLKEAEANQIVQDVQELNLTPEELGDILRFVRSDQFKGMMPGPNDFEDVVHTEEPATGKNTKKTTEETNDEED